VSEPCEPVCARPDPTDDRGGHVTPTISIAGTFRVHFNRHGAAPLIWCIATDTFELAVADFEITTPLRPVFRPKATPDDEDGKPSAWLETTGTLTIGPDGRARIA
jgi:hypothetical protein